MTWQEWVGWLVIVACFVALPFIAERIWEHQKDDIAERVVGKLNAQVNKEEKRWTT